MPLRIGVLGASHMHAHSYVAHLKSSARARIIGFCESEPDIASQFGEQTGVERIPTPQELFDKCDAVVVCSTNVEHAAQAIAAAEAGKHILCEKPLATTLRDADEMIAAAAKAKVNLMTAFPCRFSSAFQALKAQVRAGEFGPLIGISATNRGRCPFGWFVDKSRSGGGAMIDHVVHVADLLLDLLGEEPKTVQAYTGSNMYGEEWEDTAMLSIEYESGLIATLDSSWSRPQNFKTWGDVTMRVVGTEGLVELDMFGREIETYSEKGYSASSFGENLDGAMIEEFLDSIEEKRAPIVTGEHGRAALRVALMGYESLANVAVG